MSKQAVNTYVPDYTVSPGAVLEEILQERAIRKTEFARRAGLSEKTVSQIIHGKGPIVPATAIQFERVLGVSAEIWNNLEAAYRGFQARKDQKEHLQRQGEWASRFPLKELAKRKIIAKRDHPAEASEELLRFFGMGSIEAWEQWYQRLSLAYRHSPSYTSAPESVATWLRIAQNRADDIETAPFDRAAFIEALKAIRLLTTETPGAFSTRMVESCRQAGVALVFVSEFPGTHLYGATRWLSSEKALIALSLRYKTDDQFWFSFFHESAHVLHEGKKKVFLEDEDMIKSDEEKAADRFASDWLISPKDYRALVRKPLSRKAVEVFAERISIAPGIVVGRLQHDKHIPYDWLNGLKRRFTLVEI